jgi:hypothetical protein
MGGQGEAISIVQGLPLGVIPTGATQGPFQGWGVGALDRFEAQDDPRRASLILPAAPEKLDVGFRRIVRNLPVEAAKDYAFTDFEVYVAGTSLSVECNPGSVVKDRENALAILWSAVSQYSIP